MAAPSGTVTPSGPSPTGYTIGALEGGGIAFLGAFATTFATTMSLVTSVIAGAGAFAAFLGYHAYQTS